MGGLEKEEISREVVLIKEGGNRIVYVYMCILMEQKWRRLIIERNSIRWKLGIEGIRCLFYSLYLNGLQGKDLYNNINSVKYLFKKNYCYYFRYLSRKVY